MRITGGGGGRVADRERLRRIGGRLLAAPRGAVGLFALSSLVAIGAVGAFLFVQISRSSDAASLRTSQVVSRVIGHAVVEPLVDDRLLAGNPDAAAAFTSGIRAHMSDRYVVAVELVTLTGRIVYAGDRSRVGSVRALPVEARQALAGRSVARDGIGVGDAVSGGITVRTVWQVIHAHPSGAPVLLETLLRHDVIAARTARTWRPLLIALVAALVALWLVQIPVAVAITRRLRQAQQEREAMLVRLVGAESAERRRVAADLHDGVVQDLAAVAFSLGATADAVAELDRDEVRERLRNAASGVREAKRRLRTLMVEIYPANLRSAGLQAALDDLVGSLRADGLDATLTFHDAAPRSSDTDELVYRVAREAIRNVRTHAAARSAHVTVVASEDGSSVVVEVTDDGCGFDERTAVRRRQQGHLGLELLSERVGDAGGDVDVTSSVGRGTRVRVAVPRR